MKTSVASGVLLEVQHPSERGPDIEKFHTPAELWAVSTALAGFVLAVVFYGLRILNPNNANILYTLIYNKPAPANKP